MSVWYQPRNTLFIHVPRTAGTSMERNWFLGKGGHETIREYPEAKANGAFSFSFVRNPWDRFVSAYFIQNHFVPDFANFNDYIDKNCREDYPYANVYNIHFLPMTYFLLDEDGKIGVDFVGRYENLRADWEYVTNKMEVENDLQHLRKSEHAPYKECYTRESWDIIGNLYAYDIELFGYSGDTFDG